jgi:hypothetical protein
MQGVNAVMTRHPFLVRRIVKQIPIENAKRWLDHIVFSKMTRDHALIAFDLMNKGVPFDAATLDRYDSSWSNIHYLHTVRFAFWKNWLATVRSIGLVWVLPLFRDMALKAKRQGYDFNHHRCVEHGEEFPIPMLHLLASHEHPLFFEYFDDRFEAIEFLIRDLGVDVNQPLESGCSLLCQSWLTAEQIERLVALGADVFFRHFHTRATPLLCRLHNAADDLDPNPSEEIPSVDVTLALAPDMNVLRTQNFDHDSPDTFAFEDDEMTRLWNRVLLIVKRKLRERAKCNLQRAKSLLTSTFPEADDFILRFAVPEVTEKKDYDDDFTSCEFPGEPFD